MEDDYYEAYYCRECYELYCICQHPTNVLFPDVDVEDDEND